MPRVNSQGPTPNSQVFELGSWRLGVGGWELIEGPPEGGPYDLEVDRRVEADVARVQDGVRTQPRRTISAEVLVEARARVGVEQVVQIDADVGTRPPESEDLRESHVHRVEPVRIHLPQHREV